MEKFNSGKNLNQGYYESFEPTHINRDWTVTDMSILNLLSRADQQLGRLDTFSNYVNIDLFIQMHITKEAVQSSKIEGTQTNIEEAVLKEPEVRYEGRDDWNEVQNYVKAMNDAMEMMEELPFSSRLIKNTHKVLLRGVRGKHKMPGEYRSSQNWIGGATLNDAVFIPPVHTLIPELMTDLEKFANNWDNPLPDLIKAAIIHYQFETIHPFLDGNGRVGRLMITLYLVSRGILKRPILYLSDYFERNRMLYYDNLTRARELNDLNQWVKFFLVGVNETAEKGVSTFDGILQLQKKVDMILSPLGSRSRDALKVVEYLYNSPVVDAPRVAQIINKTPKTAYNLIAELEKIGILKEFTGGQRGKLYRFQEYIDLFK